MTEVYLLISSHIILESNVPWLISPDNRGSYTHHTGESRYGPSSEYNSTGTTGPHQSRVANKIDPRVDSDADIRARHQPFSGNNYNTATTASPHTSNIANKVDPHVDSDLTYQAVPQPYAGPADLTGTTSAAPATTTTAPHSSSAANKLGPRIDSADVSILQQGLPGNTYTNPYSSSHMASTTTGPHKSNLANKLDPRVDSDRENRAQREALAGSSYNNPTAGATAGPHRTNIANKLDPRVDSDLDSQYVGTQRNF